MEKVFNVGRVLLITVPFLLLACSKSDDNGNLPPGSIKLPGYIYHQYTSEVNRINMQTWEESVSFDYNAYSTVSWGLSRDGKIRLMTSRESGTYDRTQFTLVNMADNTVINHFDYVPLYGNSTRNHGEISFDNSLILIQPDNGNGIVILDTSGEVKHQMPRVNDEEFSSSDEAVWLPGNSILFTFNQMLLRTDPPYTSITPVKQMNYEKWGNIRVSPDGTKMTFYIGRHMFMMDTDGNNMVQVTDSNENEEIFAEFSPDGKYLLIGADYFHAPQSGNSHWFLKIIPADGKKYDLDNDPAVIPVIPKGSNTMVRANRVTLWRP